MVFVLESGNHISYYLFRSYKIQKKKIDESGKGVFRVRICILFVIFMTEDETSAYVHLVSLKCVVHIENEPK